MSGRSSRGGVVCSPRVFRVSLFRPLQTPSLPLSTTAPSIDAYPSPTMKSPLPTTLLLALTLTLTATEVAAAPRIIITVTTGPGLIPSGSTVLYHNDGTKTNFGYFLDGCKSKGGVKQFCIDSGKKRAHVVYSDGYKRCFKQEKESSELCGGDEGCYKGVCNRCWRYEFGVSGCNW